MTRGVTLSHWHVGPAVQFSLKSDHWPMFLYSFVGQEVARSTHHWPLWNRCHPIVLALYPQEPPPLRLVGSLAIFLTHPHCFKGNHPAVAAPLPSVCTPPNRQSLTRSHLVQATRVKMNSSSTAESRVSRHCCASKPALARSLRRSETTAAAVARGPMASPPAAAEEPDVGVLARQPTKGSTRGRCLWWGLPDLELECMCKDTRHKIYIGSGRPAPCAWCWVEMIG
jgi:hypothetical protein